MKQGFLDIFGLKPASEKVLYSIVKHGVSTVADLSARLNMPKSTVYDAVIPLLDNSLINEYSDERGKSFGISDTEQLTRAHKQKIDEMQRSYASLISFMKKGSTRDDVAKPKIKFYSGALGIRQAFRDMPWSKDIKESYLMWPMKDMLRSVDEDFLRWHSEQRLKYKVILNAIQKDSDRSLQTSKHAWLESNFKEKFRRVRYLPKGTDWKMSFWIYGNRCLFASGGTEKIAFTIHSREFCEMMKLLWDNSWAMAKE